MRGVTKSLGNRFRFEDSDTPRFRVKIHGINHENQLRFEIYDSDQPVFWRISGVNEKTLPLKIQTRFLHLPFFLEPPQKFGSGSIITPESIANPYDCCPPWQRRIAEAGKSFQVQRIIPISCRNALFSHCIKGVRSQNTEFRIRIFALRSFSPVFYILSSLVALIREAG